MSVLLLSAPFLHILTTKGLTALKMQHVNGPLCWKSGRHVYICKSTYLYLVKVFLLLPGRCVGQSGGGASQGERRAGEERDIRLRRGGGRKPYAHSEFLGAPSAFRLRHSGRLQPPIRHLHPSGVYPSLVLSLAVRVRCHHRPGKRGLCRRRDLYL